MENNNNQDNASTYFWITIFIAMFIGGMVARISGSGFFGFIIVAGIIAGIFAPILASIGRAKDIRNQVGGKVDKLEDEGINTDEKYISPYGNGIIIDRKAQKLILIHNKMTEPFSVPFQIVKDCELYEDINEEISYSEDGYTGVILGRGNPDSEVAKRLKESAQYGPRKINRTYRQLGVTVTCNHNGVIKRYDIDYIEGQLPVEKGDDIKGLAIDAVNNIRSAISNVKSSDNTLEDADVESKYLEVKEKLKDYNRKMTSEEINLLVEINGDKEVDKADVSIDDYNEQFEWISNDFEPNRKDTEKLLDLKDKLDNIIKQDTWTVKELATWKNYHLDFLSICDKYIKCYHTIKSKMSKGKDKLTKGEILSITDKGSPIQEELNADKNSPFNNLPEKEEREKIVNDFKEKLEKIDSKANNYIKAKKIYDDIYKVMMNGDITRGDFANYYNLTVDFNNIYNSCKLK